MTEPELTAEKAGGESNGSLVKTKGKVVLDTGVRLGKAMEWDGWLGGVEGQVLLVVRHCRWMFGIGTSPVSTNRIGWTG